MNFRARPAMKDVVARLEEASTLALLLGGRVDSPTVVVVFDGKSDLARGDETGMMNVTTGTFEKSESTLSKLSGSEKDALLALLAEKDALLAENSARLAKKDALLAENGVRHAEYVARLSEMQVKIQELEAARSGLATRTTR